MGGYPVVQNPWAEVDARERITICVRKPARNINRNLSST
jgi:hypothetical protein